MERVVVMWIFECRLVWPQSVKRSTSIFCEPSIDRLMLERLRICKANSPSSINRRRPRDVQARQDFRRKSGHAQGFKVAAMSSSSSSSSSSSGSMYLYLYGRSSRTLKHSVASRRAIVPQKKNKMPVKWTLNRPTAAGGRCGYAYCMSAKYCP